MSYLERRVTYLKAKVKYIIESRKMELYKEIEEVEMADLYCGRIGEDGQETAEYEI